MSEITFEKVCKEVCTVDGVKYPILKKFTVLHPGWELDDIGYIIDYQGIPRLVLSDHGTFDFVEQDLRNYFYENKSDPTPTPLDQCKLMNKIKNLETYIQETREALEILRTKGEKQ